MTQPEEQPEQLTSEQIEAAGLTAADVWAIKAILGGNILDGQHRLPLLRSLLEAEAEGEQ